MAQDDRIYVMACYATHLFMGQNLRCRELKCNTIRLYLKAVETLTATAKHMSPLIDHMGRIAPLIQDVLKEAKRWEKIPKRREPLTKPMLISLQRAGRASHHKDSIDSAVADWATLGSREQQRKRNVEVL